MAVMPGAGSWPTPGDSESTRPPPARGPASALAAVSPRRTHRTKMRREWCAPTAGRAHAARLEGKADPESVFSIGGATECGVEHPY